MCNEDQNIIQKNTEAVISHGLTVRTEHFDLRTLRSNLLRAKELFVSGLHSCRL